VFGLLHSDINLGHLHLTGLLNSQKGRAGKVKAGIISETKFLGTISVDRYSFGLKARSITTVAVLYPSFERCNNKYKQTHLCCTHSRKKIQKLFSFLNQSLEMQFILKSLEL
jgi:hypothetical protein